MLQLLGTKFRLPIEPRKERPILLWALLLSSFSGIMIWYIGRLTATPFNEWLDATITTFSFFTTLTNAAVIVMAGALLYGRGRLYDWFKLPAVQSAWCLYIAFVGLGFWALLGGPGEMNTLLEFIPQATAHTLSPILGAVIWYRVVPKGQLNWRHPILWLLYPLLYLIFWLFRGPIVGYYPYFFVDVNVFGYIGVARWSAVLMIAFLVLGAGMLIIDKRRAFEKRVFDPEPREIKPVEAPSVETDG